jgi:succinate dehydrogenase/fumarate reductase flavoprotein subunit
MLGAFVYGKFCGENAAAYCANHDPKPVDEGQVAAEKARVLAPLARSEGLTPFQVEYKTRRLVNDYLQPPKVTRKMQIGLQRFEEIKEDLEAMSAADPHELMRAMEAYAIRDCAEMAARSSLYRTESRWGLYHHYVDFPGKNDDDWFCHVQLTKGAGGEMLFHKRAVEPYVIELDEQEKHAYSRLRIAGQPAAA